MNPWTAFLIGVVLGWLIEFAIDWFFWRRPSSEEKEIEELQAKLQAAEARIAELEGDESTTEEVDTTLPPEVSDENDDASSSAVAMAAAGAGGVLVAETLDDASQEDETSAEIGEVDETLVEVDEEGDDTSLPIAEVTTFGAGAAFAAETLDDTPEEVEDAAGMEVTDETADLEANETAESDLTLDSAGEADELAEMEPSEMAELPFDETEAEAFAGAGFAAEEEMPEPVQEPDVAEAGFDEGGFADDGVIEAESEEEPFAAENAETEAEIESTAETTGESFEDTSAGEETEPSNDSDADDQGGI